jgi:hypothetical protein
MKRLVQTIEHLRRALIGLSVVLVATLVVGQSIAGAAPSSSSRASTHPKFKATGYFYVKKDGGRWYMVTPQGAPFYAAGIDTVATDGSGTDQVTGQCPYCETVQNDFPSTAAWATATVAQLQSWGFNTLGPFSDYTDVGSQMPFEVELNMASGDDWFAPSFVTNADEVAATQVAPLANDPNLIGYFTDSELDWGPLLGSGDGSTETALQQYLALPAGSPGLAIAEQYEGNPNGFLYVLAKRYFSVTTAAVRMYDTHHMILGVKAEGQEIQPGLLKAAAPYVNVFSIEDYVLWPGFAQAVDVINPAYLPVQQDLANFEKIVQRPLMIGEYSSIAYGPETPSTVPGIYAVAPNQQVRASNYENFIAPLYEDAPWLVGDDWFQYVDEPVNGRTGDGENNNFGMIDVNGNPYTDMVTAVQMMHNVIASEEGETGSVCDSWATSNSKVICTSHMAAQSAGVPLNIVTDTMPTGRVGADYYFGGVYAAGGTPDYTYSITQGSLPTGLLLDRTTGIITGKPKISGTWSFTVRARDSGGSTPVSQPLSITVNPRTAVKITTTLLRSATVNHRYSFTLAATGGTLPFTWAITSGSLPTGVSLDADGSIAGTPSVSGTFPITVQVTDSSNPVETASASLTLTAKKS